MTPEIKIILDRAEDCLADAEFGLENDRLQVAANRSYYCVFDCIAALLHYKDIYAKTHQGAHQKFSELYIKSGIMDIQLAKILSSVFDLRQSADYDFQSELAEQEVTAAVEHARTFLAATRAYFESEI